MDDSSLSDADGPFASPTLGAILGVKASLRLRPHGSTQKAHVVLRRVEYSDDDGDDEEPRSVAYFSLFAQKRIEVKPGKEILLAIASPDGTFKDQAVILEGDLLDSGESSEEEEDVGGIIEDDVFDWKLVGRTIPPKIRRVWTKQYEVNPMTGKFMFSLFSRSITFAIDTLQTMFLNRTQLIGLLGCRSNPSHSCHRSQFKLKVHSSLRLFRLRQRKFRPMYRPCLPLNLRLRTLGRQIL